MKSLVTGGCGFIGSNLVDRLVSMGHEVVVIDNLSSEVHEQFYFNTSGKVTYHKFDIAEYEDVRPLFEGVDNVFHLAAESRIQPAIKNPMLAVRTNTLGTCVMLQCAREAGVKKFMYSSTSSGYGLKNQVPNVETQSDDCLNAYSVSKVSGEKLCKMYSDLHGLNTTIFRYFNVYGEREPVKGQYAPVVGLFLKQKKAQQPLTIVPDGKQRRDFTHVSDVVEANVLACTVDQKKYGETFNIGTGKNHSVLELAEMISVNTVFIEPRIGEARETQANNSKAREVLGWVPKVSIEDWIKEKLAE